MGQPQGQGNELFGLPFRTAMFLVYVAGFVLGHIIFRNIVLGWCPIATIGRSGDPHLAYTLASSGFLIVLGGAVAIAVIAVFGNFEETWHRLGILSVAVGVLVSGFWAIAIHRIEIHPDYFYVRGLINPIASRYPLTDGNKIVTRVQHVNSSTFAIWRRRRQTTYSFHLVKSNGSEIVLHSGRGGPATWPRAAVRFEHESAAAPLPGN